MLKQKFKCSLVNSLHAGYATLLWQPKLKSKFTALIRTLSCPTPWADTAQSILNFKNTWDATTYPKARLTTLCNNASTFLGTWSWLINTWSHKQFGPSYFQSYYSPRKCLTLAWSLILTFISWSHDQTSLRANLGALRGWGIICLIFLILKCNSQDAGMNHLYVCL